MKYLRRYQIFTFTFMFVLFSILFMTQVYGSSVDEWAGYWTYEKTIVIEYSNELSNYYGSTEDNTKISYTATGKKVDYRFNYTGPGYQADLYDEALNDPEAYQYENIILPGEHAYAEYNFSQPDKQYRENTLITIDVSAELYDYLLFGFEDIKIYALAWTNIYDPGEITYGVNKDISNNIRIPDRLVPLLFEVGPESNQLTQTGEFTGYTPYGINDGDIMSIEIEIGFNPFASLNLYSGHDGVELDYDTIKIYHIYTWKYGTKGIFVGSDAADFPGEDNGINVPSIIITGILGAGAALAATGANKVEDPKSRFKMYVNKDFGSAIRYDRPPVTVYARMAEIKEDGSEIDRPDLTESIEFTSGGLPIEIGDTQMASNYMAALISAQSSPGGKNPDEGIVSIRYTGEGGSFQNDVTFRLVGKPYIEHEHIESHSGSVIVKMILGDQLTYEAFFKPMDFVDVPNVTIDGNDEIIASLEKLDDDWYKAILENKSNKDEDKKTVIIHLKAETEQELAESEITVMLYPEGISIDANFDDEERLIVRTEENDSKGSLDAKIKATRLDVTLAIIDQSDSKPKAIICDMKDVTTKFEPFGGDTEIASNLKDTFKYQINEDQKDEGVYFIEPLVTLPELEDGKPYILSSAVSCTYKNQTYEKSLMIKLIGEKPTPIDNWEQEHEYLLRAIHRYGLSGNGDAKEMMRSVKHRSATELCMIRRAIIIESAYYYTKESKEFSDLESKLAKLEFVFSIIKFFGDQAFSYLITAYGGGPMVEAFMSPLKDYFTDFIGEVGAQLYWGEEINYSSVNLLVTLEAGVENMIMNLITGENPPTPKKIGALVASLVMLNFTKHYCYTEDSKGDIYKTLINMGGDFTVNSLKTLASKYMGNYFEKNPQFKEKISKWLGHYVTNHLGEIDQFDFVIKYVEETIGLVISNSYQNTVSALEDSSNFELTISVGSGSITINIAQNLQNIADFFYNQFISILNLPQNKPDQPKTPPYIRA